MIQWYVELQKLLREIRIKSADALELYVKDGGEAARPVNDYLKSDFKTLRDCGNARILVKRYRRIWVCISALECPPTIGTLCPQ
jgi:hypothetical protein